MVEWFPPGSPGRKALIRAARKLRLSYILGEPHKLRMVMNEITAGNRRFTDIHKATGLERPELEDLLRHLVEAGHIAESRETPVSFNGRGRPARIFEISENK